MSEKGVGSQEFRRVSKVFAHDDEQVIYLPLIVPGFGRNTEEQPFLVATSNHPVRVESDRGLGGAIVQQWVPIGELWSTANPFALRAGTRFGSPANLIQYGERSDLAWYECSDEGWGRLLSIDRKGSARYGLFDEQVWNDDLEGADPFKTRVYNLEVDEFNTYFVSEAGLWVHNKALLRAESGI